MNLISARKLIFLLILKLICLIHFGERKGNDFQCTACFAVAMKGQTTTRSSFKGRTTTSSNNKNTSRRLGGGKGGQQYSRYGYHSGSSSAYHSGYNGYSSNHNQAYSSYYGYYGNTGSGSGAKNNNYTGSYSHSNQSRSSEWYVIALIVIIVLIGIALIYLSIPEIMVCSSANKNRRKTTNEAIVSDYRKFDDNVAKDEVNTTKAVARSRDSIIIVHSGRARAK
jgi:hypothetical protein